MLWSSPFYPNMNLSQGLSIFTHRNGHILGTVCQHSRDIQYVSVYNLDLCSYNFHISRFLQSGICKGELDVYRFMSKHSSFFPTIPCQSLRKILYVIINRCAAALLSFRYHSYK